MSSHDVEVTLLLCSFCYRSIYLAQPGVSSLISVQPQVHLTGSTFAHFNLNQCNTLLPCNTLEDTYLHLLPDLSYRQH